MFCYLVLLARIFAAFNVDFIGECRATIGRAHITKFTTFNNCAHAWDEAQKIWIPPKEEDRMRERNIAGFRKTKKTTNTDLGTFFSQPIDDEDSSDDDGSYDHSAEDAPPTIYIHAFQVEMQAAFDQLRITQDAHSA